MPVISKRLRYYNHRRFCEQCGNAFDASRHDARFCSAACRSRCNRETLKRSRQIERIKRDIDKAMKDLPHAFRDAAVAEIIAHVSGWETPVL